MTRLRKFTGLLLAMALLLATLPLTPYAQADNCPLRIDISTCRTAYTLLSTMTYTATITNMGNAVVRNVSAEALFGKDIVPLAQGSQLTAEKSSLAPGESLQFSYRARLNTLKALDVLLYPCLLLRGLFCPTPNLSNNHFNNGREYVEASARINLLSLLDACYDAASTVRVWYGYPDTDDFSSVLTNGFFEGYEDAGIVVDGDKSYYLLLSRAKNLTAGIQADGAGLNVSTIRHNAAWVFWMEPAGDECFAIRSLASGLAMAAAEDSTVRLEAYTGAAHQLWTKRMGRDGQYQIINASSGKAIDIGGSGDALVQGTPGPGASQLWELMDVDAQALANPHVPDLNGRADWAKNAVRYPQEGKLVPAGPIDVQWYQDASIGELEYYELAFDGGEPVYVLPTGARIMGYRWYTTQVAIHSICITAVLTDGGRVPTEVRSFPVSKKGIGWGTLHRVEDLDIAWYYNWYTTPCTGLPGWLRFEPQVWGDFPDLGLHGLWEQGFRSVMAFNEPDSATQANMTVAQAVGLWPRLVETGLRLGSPAMSNNAAAAANWLAPFMGEAGGSVDYMVMHCYTNSSNVSDVLKMIDGNWAKYRKPIWIKEFALASFGANSPWGAGKGDPAAVAAFMEQLLGELDRRPYVERYAWYPFGTDDIYGGASALFDYGTGKLTALGEVYRGLGVP